MATKTPTEYYDSSAIDALDATYNIIYGQRSNGKTFRLCRKILDAYLDPDISLPSAYLRRLDEMIKPSNIASLFDPHIEYIKEKTNGKYNAIFYRSRAFYLCAYNEDGQKIRQDHRPFCRTYSINTAETTKGQDAGEIKYIVFDEFLTRSFYLQNEFILFQNVISSLIRSRSGVKLYLLANTVSKFCPYFAEMGLSRIKDQKQGTIDLYTMGKTSTKIAVEYCGTAAATEKVQEYYCFDNPELNMITKGVWEIALYRHIPAGIGEIFPEFEFYIVFDGQMLRGAIYIFQDAPLITISRRYKEIPNPDNTLIFSDELDDPPDPNPLHRAELAYPVTTAEEIIISLIQQKKTYFATNEDGEIFVNWLKYASKGGLTV